MHLCDHKKCAKKEEEIFSAAKAGEWKSKAYLWYIVERWRQVSHKVSECKILTAAVDNSDEEDDD